jgi:NAD(P)-dependent dehydrogenase (short-subunit alcohol dehydrogenase family)
MTERTLTGKVILITGASSGIGAAAARELHRRGATVYVAGRSPDRTAAVAADVGTEPILADFARLADVRAAAEQVLSRCDRLDVLVNNAGIWVMRRQETEDGHELMFQVNYLAPVLLTALLRDRLIASAPARVITTASIANLSGFVRMHDLESELFVGTAVYGTTKLEDILFTRELGRRLAGTGVLATCFNPGPVATDLGRGTLIGAGYASSFGRMLTKTPERGADTLIWLITQPAERLKQGGYYSNRRPGLLNPQAHNGRLARELWEQTEQMLGITED